MKKILLWQRTVALILMFSFIPAVMAQTTAPSGQTAGDIRALIPGASRNGGKAKLHQELQWNDVLKTDPTGRMRVGFRDGSFLSVGNGSELKVAQHDEATQQTSLELNYGRVRSQVSSITRAGGKYEVKTPTAVAGVIGTDFEVAFINGVTVVNVFSGAVVVTSLLGTMASVTVGAGQSVTVSASGEISALGPLNAAVTEVLPEATQGEVATAGQVAQAGVANIGTIGTVASIVAVATTAGAAGATTDSKGSSTTVSPSSGR